MVSPTSLPGRCYWSSSAPESSCERSLDRCGAARQKKERTIMFDDDDERHRLKAEVRLRARKRGDNPWARLVWGIAILTAGVIGWLDHTGDLHASDYLEWWPLVVIAM